MCLEYSLCGLSTLKSVPPLCRLVPPREGPCRAVPVRFLWSKHRKRWLNHTFLLDTAFWPGLGWCHMRRSERAENQPKNPRKTSLSAQSAISVCRLMTLDRIDTELAFEAAAEPSPSSHPLPIQAPICTT